MHIDRLDLTKYFFGTHRVVWKYTHLGRSYSETLRVRRDGAYWCQVSSDIRFRITTYGRNKLVVRWRGGMATITAARSTEHESAFFEGEALDLTER